MRITVVYGPFLPVPPLLGGAIEKAWFGLAEEFARQGHEVVQISRSYPQLADHGQGAHRRVTGYTWPGRRSRALLFHLLYAIRAAIAAPPADVIVATNSIFLPFFLPTGRKGRIYLHVGRHPKGQLRWYRRVGRFQTASEATAIAIRAEISSRHAAVRVIPYPLPPELSPPPDRAPQAVRKKEILYAGRIHPEKGVHLLLDAFLRIPAALRENWSIAVIGPQEEAVGGGGSQYVESLKDLATRAGASIAIEEPEFDARALFERESQASIFVYPSLAERGETFGLAVLEAMACGMAPVVSNLACFNDFIDPSVNGLQFDHRCSDPAQALADTLESLMRDADLRERIAGAAHHTALRYQLPLVAARFVADFESLLGK